MCAGIIGNRTVTGLARGHVQPRIRQTRGSPQEASKGTGFRARAVDFRGLAALLVVVASSAAACTPAQMKVADAYREALPPDFAKFHLFGDRIETNLGGWNATYHRGNGTWSVGGPFWIDHPVQYESDASACDSWNEKYSTTGPATPKPEPTRNPLYAIKQAAWTVSLGYADSGGVRHVVGVDVTWNGGSWHADVAPEGPQSDVALVHALRGYLLLDPANGRGLSLPVGQASAVPTPFALALPGTHGLRTVRQLDGWPVILHPDESPVTILLDGSMHAFPFASWDEESHSGNDVLLGVNGTWHWIRMEGGWRKVATAPDPGATLDNWAQNLYEGGWFLAGEQSFVWRRGDAAPQQVPWAGRVHFARQGEYGYWATGDALYELDPRNLTVHVIARPTAPTGPHPAVAGTGFMEPLRPLSPSTSPTTTAPASDAPSTAASRNVPLPAWVFLGLLATLLARRRSAR